MNTKQEFDNELDYIRKGEPWSQTTVETPTQVVADYSLRLIHELRRPRSVSIIQTLWIRLAAYAYHQADKLN